MNPVRISQCMIVKNEEQNIVRALSWGKEIMWEQIVVDTGSADRTVELAEQLGAKVFHFPWIDDFAAAKNYAIGQAQGEWIAFLDADEYMMPEDVCKIQSLIQGRELEGLDGISTGWQQLDEEGKIFSSATQVRFFRNRPDIRYRRRIHEQLVSEGEHEFLTADAVASISIFHTGYQGKAFAEKKKSGRNLRLIQEELKEHPDDYEMLGYLGDEYYAAGEFQEAADYYEQAASRMPEHLASYDQRSAVTFSRLMTIYMEGMTFSRRKAEKVYEEAVQRMPEEADFDYLAGRFYASQGEAKRATACLEEALRKLNTYGCANRALLLAGNLADAYDILVRCCYETGERQKCISYGAAYLGYDRYAMTILSRILMILAPGPENLEGQEKLYEEVIGFLSKIYDFRVLKDRVFLWKAAERSGCIGMAGYLERSLFTDAERQMLALQQ